MPQQKEQRAPLLIPCVAFAAGIAAGQWGQVSWTEAGLASIAFTVLWAVALWRQERRASQVAFAASIFGLGALAEIWHRPGQAPVLDVAARQTVIAEGCVVEPPVWFSDAASESGEDRERFTLELAPGARAHISVYLKPGETAANLEYGQRVGMPARFRAIHNYENPGAFDAVGYFAHRQIYWNASVTGARNIRVLPGACGVWWRAAIFALRGNLLGRIEHLFGVGTKTAGTLRAMLLGDATRLDENDAEAYRRSGVYHVLVVSGLHLAAIGAILLFFLRIVRTGVTASLLWTASIAWLYAALCGGTAPVVRAAGGLTLFALGRWFYRRPSVLNLLAAVALAYLITDPEQLFEASFQLSFLAVALIGGLAAPMLDATFTPISRALRDITRQSADFGHGPRLAELRVELRLLADAISALILLPSHFCLKAFAGCGRFAAWIGESSLLAMTVQLGMALPMVTYFHRFPLVGLGANLTVAPLMTAAVPLGLAAVATTWHWIAVPTAWMVERSQSLTDWYAQTEQSWAGSISRVPAPPDWLAIAFVIATVALALLVRRRSHHRIFLGLGFAAALATLLLHPFTPQSRSGKLELTAIDVGQGDSLLAVSPGGSTLLIDTGGIPGFAGRDDTAPSFDIGEEVVSPYLWSRSIRHLDVVAITHPDADHAGGLGAILRNFRPRELWMGAELPDETILLAQSLGVTVRRPRAGESFDWDGATIDVLAPRAQDASSKINNRSLVVRLTYGRHSFLLTGDIERGGEYQMLDAGRLGPVTVLKVAHHGSKTSTVPEFLEAVRPTLAVISVGRDNNYGHPNPDVMNRLSEAHRQILRTDHNGLISLWTDGRYLESETRLW